MNHMERKKQEREFNDAKMAEFNSMSEEELRQLIQTINNNEKLDRLFAEGYVPIYYNSCYGGGYSLPPFIRFLLDKNKTDTFKAKLIFYYQDHMHWSTSCIDFNMIKQEFEPFVSVSEYDGLEKPFIDVRKYKEHKINQIQELYFESVDILKQYISDVMSFEFDKDDIINPHK